MKFRNRLSRPAWGQRQFKTS